MKQISDILNGKYFSDLQTEEIHDTGTNPTISSQNTQTGNQNTSEKQNKEDQQYSNQEPKHTDTPNLEQIKRMAYAIKDQVEGLLRFLQGDHNTQTMPHIQKEPISSDLVTGEQIVEGVFNGEKMIGPDGKEYAVAPNYASKSKLVEGDLMKLTIKANGQFLFKQIGPIQRKRIIGILRFDEAQQKWSVEHEGKLYKILTASATFYKGKPGDEVVLIVPEDGGSDWGAVENIISK